MEFGIHQQVLGFALVSGMILGAVAGKTNFCTMGAVSDWVNMGDTGRLRAWLLAIALAMLGVAVLEATGRIDIGTASFPPYRSPNLAWLRHLLGGLMFGIGMTLASGCGNKTLVRLGGGNLKSLVVLAVAAACAYAMLWTDFYEAAFGAWIGPTSINLAAAGKSSQALGELTGIGNAPFGVALALALLAFVFSSRDFRASPDHILGGAVIGVAVCAAWYVTGGAMGQAWKEYADFAEVRPLRVATQSFTFISPMGDLARYLTSPGDSSLLNFGIMALLGVIAGSFLHALLTRSFRIEWFVNTGDFANHVAGAALMGIGGVLAMGCSVGQAITGVSTLALGSLLTLLAIVAGAAATMKYQYWRLTQDA